jgi:hypothetical protein
MNNLAKKILWTALVLALLLSLVWQFVPLRDASARLDAIPLSGFGFAGRDLPLAEVEASIYKPARVLKRIYAVGRQQVIVIAIDGSRNRHAIHDPTFCFRGAGWTIGGYRDIPVPGGAARLLSLSKEGRTIEAMYWMSDSRNRYTSAMHYWWQTTMRRLTLGNSGEEPILFVLQPANADSLDWEKLLEQFPQLVES